MSEEHLAWDLFDQIPGTEALQHWECYDSAFQAMNTRTPCRQSFRRDDYLAALSDPDFTKLVVWEQDTGNILGGAMGIYDLSRIPWINPEFFEHKFPELIGRLMYVPSIWSVPNSRRAGLMEIFAQGCLRLLERKGGLAIAFDHSLNQNPWLPKIIPQITGLKPHGSLPEGELDHQVYYLMGK